MSSIKSNDRFIRWQTNLRQQVSFTNNILLTISIGVTGFIFNLLNQTDFNPDDFNKFMISKGLIILIISIFLGVIVNLSRIIDFRLTLKKIKTALNNTSDLQNLKSLKDTFGNITWFLFYSQILTIFIGLIFLCIGLFNLHLNKLT